MIMDHSLNKKFAVIVVLLAFLTMLNTIVMMVKQEERSTFTSVDELQRQDIDTMSTMTSSSTGAGPMITPASNTSVAISGDIFSPLISHTINGRKGAGDSSQHTGDGGISDEEVKSTTNTSSSSLLHHDHSIYIHAFPNHTTLQNTSTYEKLKSLINFNIPIPQNLNIVLMGDSLTRYQYLDLVYFLSHNGTWVQRDDQPNMVIEGTHPNWNSFYNYTNFVLKPYEECDCYRHHGRNNVNLSTENRYFHDRERNNKVTYLNKFGDHPFKTSWNVSDVHNNHTMVTSASDLNFIYEGDWVNTMKDFVCKMEEPITTPSVRVLLFNAGIWPNNKHLKNVTIQKEIVNALRSCNITSIYKSTTSRAMKEYERQLCNMTDLCFDISWTDPLVPSEHYWDKNHFLNPIYSMLNIHLLSILAAM